MNIEISAGAIIYKIENNKLLFLVVHSDRNNEWGFAKGHCEQNETEIDTAKREIFEETGICSLTFVEGFKEIDTYKIEGRLPSTKGKIVDKKVIYFLCYTDKNFIKSKDNEIGQICWCSYEKALSLLKHKKQKEFLTKANKFIEENLK